MLKCGDMPMIQGIGHF